MSVCEPLTKVTIPNEGLASERGEHVWNLKLILRCQEKFVFLSIFLALNFPVFTLTLTLNHFQPVYLLPLFVVKTQIQIELVSHPFGVSYFQYMFILISHFLPALQRASLLWVSKNKKASVKIFVFGRELFCWQVSNFVSSIFHGWFPLLEHVPPLSHISSKISRLHLDLCDEKRRTFLWNYIHQPVSKSQQLTTLPLSDSWMSLGRDRTLSCS